MSAGRFGLLSYLGCDTHNFLSIRYDEERMAIYLITGVAGFIGSSIARALLEQGQQVRGIDNLATGKRENIAEIGKRIDFREADLLDLEAMYRACSGGGIMYSTRPRFLRCRNRCWIRWAATAPMWTERSTFWSPPGMPKVGASCTPPRPPLTATPPVAQARGHDTESDLAICGCQTGQRALHDFVLPLLRAGNGLPALLQYFWSRQDPTSPYSGVLAKFITQMLKGEQPTIFGDGTQSRDFTYIDNAVKANLLACQSAGREVAGGCLTWLPERGST